MQIGRDLVVRNLGLGLYRFGERVLLKGILGCVILLAIALWDRRVASVYSGSEFFSGIG
jgi:hypothetical protein